MLMTSSNILHVCDVIWPICKLGSKTKNIYFFFVFGNSRLLFHKFHIFINGIRFNSCIIYIMCYVLVKILYIRYILQRTVPFLNMFTDLVVNFSII